MDFLSVDHQPGRPLGTLLLAFSGWADAAEGATSAVKFLRRKLKARKFAEFDPEEFYDFTQTRPTTTRTRDGKRRIHWPANEFFHLTNPETGAGLMVFMGVEPNLRWRAYSQAIAGLAREQGVATVIHLGALLDAVPHTRPVKLSGTATRPDLSEFLEGRAIRSSNYQGPAGISSSVMDACVKQGLGYSSIWGHTPHYLQAAPNYRVAYALLQPLTRLLGLPLELEELRAAAAKFDDEVARAVGDDGDIASYVAKLEGQYDEQAAASSGLDPEELLRDVERFLRGER